jgi:hypothetical protein
LGVFLIGLGPYFSDDPTNHLDDIVLEVMTLQDFEVDLNNKFSEIIAHVSIIIIDKLKKVVEYIVINELGSFRNIAYPLIPYSKIVFAVRMNHSCAGAYLSFKRLALLNKSFLKAGSVDVFRK